MKVKLNDREIQIHTENNQLIELMKTNQLYHESGIAVAINEEILPRTIWEQYQVQDNDNILIITATQGG
ncbi:sulfur carrier protein [Reichenbachiella faecimaris]|uniref:Sulfur carrier protein n=1 Tax=Reichenbachiella faecimaris TaxID=692418 RepID=A0A1W2G535_REIFA|nr:sulfur carrier protein ThiS [Reichenbachiella faecimaris]SMD31701.1 sulfur carrier protein [Reichenbachiella faecimaris]